MARNCTRKSKQGNAKLDEMLSAVQHFKSIGESI